MSKVGFPGFGIGDFGINSEIFRIGSFALNWYGLIIAAGFLLAVVYCLPRTKQFAIRQDEFTDMLIFAVPAAIVGARLYYCAFNWGDYKNDLLGIFRVREGGLAIYGAIIGAVLACGVFCWVKRMHAGAVLDLCALGLLIGQAVGRWGNFFNVEVYGKETGLPWRMSVVNGWGVKVGEVHPLFLYEFFWNAAGFLLLHLLSKKRRFNGQLFMLYIAWYGIGRGLMEGLRDETYILRIGDNIAVSQLLAYLSAVAALLLLGYNLIFKQHDPEDIGLWAEKREAFFAEKAKEKESGALEGEEDCKDADTEADTGDIDIDIDIDADTDGAARGEDETAEPEAAPDEQTPEAAPDEEMPEETGDGDGDKA
ncbi:MAG: prolipoprotein diacylglyceryl transferase [Oscillospiraceae bacterium]|jgi:phosphatidylglycerol:prolipoprotein diacylglycerol transferase|nr:prolipoprotein diacylglyceryl transferase [Oscillospiraceae bacterium]